MMSDMFLSPERPFYQGSQIVNIKEIQEDTYREFANSFFMAHGQTLPESVFHYLYDKVEGQTRMRSLSEYAIHNTIKIEHGYLQGRYGGVPHVKLEEQDA